MNNKVRYCCVSCKDEFTTNNLTKHHARCIVKGGKIIWNKIPEPNSLVCKFCDKLCKNKNSHTQHIRTCPKNENRNYKNYSVGHTAWNKGLTKETNITVRNSAEKCREGWASGRIVAKEFLYTDRLRLSQQAKDKKLGGYRENAGRSKKYKVNDSNGKQTTLQSSYEYECFQLLSQLNIRWVRPKALKYNGRNYFADFYLIDYDIYLDPKNNYKAKLDADKIQLAQEQNNVKVIILLKEQITSECLRSILDMQSLDKR